MWWTYTAAMAGTVTFDTIGSGFNTYLNVYDVGGRLLGADDNSGGGVYSRLRFTVTAGQKLSVSVSGAGGTVGAIQLNWSFVPLRPARLGVARYAPLTASNGIIIRYTIVVMNSGDLPLNNVSVAQNINTDKTVLIGGSTTVPSTSEVDAYGVIWRLGTIAPHRSRTLQLQVRAKDNPFGSNIAAGNLSVTSDAGSILRTRRTINIESSVFLVGNLINIGCAIGDAIGGANLINNSTGAISLTVLRSLPTAWAWWRWAVITSPLCTARAWWHRAEAMQWRWAARTRLLRSGASTWLKYLRAVLVCRAFWASTCLHVAGKYLPVARLIKSQLRE